MKVMNILRKKRWIFILLTGLLIVNSSCIQDDYRTPARNDGSINLHITIEQSEKTQVTRNASERNDRSRIEDMNIVLASGNEIKNIIYIPSGSTSQGNLGEDESGLIQGALPAEDGNLSYHISKLETYGVEDIYIVANYREVTSASTQGDGNLNDFLKREDGTYKTVADLKALRQGTRFVSGIQMSTMFGKGEEDVSAQEEHGGKVYRVELMRTTAMVTVAINETDEGLRSGVRIIPTQICLHNVPYACFIGQDNRINKSYEQGATIGDYDIPGYSDGLLQQISWGELSGNDGEMSKLGGHGNESDVTPLFMFENLQGQNSPDSSKPSEEIGKTPAQGKEDFCSYLEVVADYYYLPESGNQHAGTIKYRLYLGENITDNFDIHRNKHYQVTLNLTGMGGLIEDGSFDYDDSGNPIVVEGGGGASWRIESTVSTAGFVGNETDVSVSGSTVKIPFVREEGKKYVIYCTEDASTSWLMTECSDDNGASMGEMSPTKAFPAVPKQDPTGQWYIEMFAKAYTHDEWEKVDGIENWTLEEWVNKGYREQDLILAEKSGSSYKEVSEITVRQWMPLPVMDPNVLDEKGNPITKPWDAVLYFSRIDVYEGEMLRWGPKEYDNWDSSKLITEGDRFGTIKEGGDSQTYNAEFGFHNVVAMYVTDRYEGGRHYVYTNPQSMMEVAAYRAGNSQGSSSEASSPYTQMRYYGLPTKEEWKKIKLYGVEDWRFPFSATEYWTSSMEGTQSYVYDYITGKESLANRAEEHRGRLVYHKNDEWTAHYSIYN